MVERKRVFTARQMKQPPEIRGLSWFRDVRVLQTRTPGAYNREQVLDVRVTITIDVGCAGNWRRQDVLGVEIQVTIDLDDGVDQAIGCDIDEPDTPHVICIANRVTSVGHGVWLYVHESGYVEFAD